jgi:hypothetical protein
MKSPAVGMSVEKGRQPQKEPCSIPVVRRLAEEDPGTEFQRLEWSLETELGVVSYHSQKQCQCL